MGFLGFLHFDAVCFVGFVFALLDVWFLSGFEMVVVFVLARIVWCEVRHCFLLSVRRWFGAFRYRCWVRRI